MFMKRLKIILLYFALPIGIFAAFVFEQVGWAATEMFLTFMGCVLLLIVIGPFVNSPTQADITRMSKDITRAIRELDKRQ